MSFTMTGGVNFISSCGASGGVGGGGGGGGNSARAGGGGGGGVLFTLVVCAERCAEIEHTVSNSRIFFI